MIKITEQPLEPARVRERLLDPGAGALVVFEGCARDTHDGRAVELLAYEAFVPMAEAGLARIREDAMERFDLKACVIEHRLGPVPLKEAAVLVGCSSAHRQAAFEAAAWIMDAIKAAVPIWKQERYGDGGQAWVEGQDRR